jgi:rhamnosyl/mannosyltransferase
MTPEAKPSGSGPVSRRLHVLHAAKIFPPPIGGIETVLDQMTRGLIQIDPNIKVDVLATDPGGHSSFEPLEGRLYVDRIRSIAQIARTPIALGYRRKLKMSKADLFHFHFPYPWAELSFLLSGIKKPYIVSYHSDIVNQKTLLRFWKPFMNRFLSKAARIIVASPHLLENSPFLHGPLAEKTVVIPFGIDTARFLPSGESRTSALTLRSRLAGSAPLLFFLGRLVYYKGAQVLIEAIREVDAHLVIAGQGPLEEDLKRSVREYGLDYKVTFVGNISPDLLPVYYQASDLFILPSTENSEAFGMVMLEAHASGIPVISSDLPTGVVYVNQHKKTGLCVKARDSKALADGIRTMLADNDLRRSMGTFAQARACLEFDTRIMAERYHKLYNDVLTEIQTNL